MVPLQRGGIGDVVAVHPWRGVGGRALQPLALPQAMAGHGLFERCKITVCTGNRVKTAIFVETASLAASGTVWYPPRRPGLGMLWQCAHGAIQRDVFGRL